MYKRQGLTVIDQAKVLCQFLRRFFWGEVKELCGKVDHIDVYKRQLYDLTTLQRDANRLLGFTAQQTLDYLQSLYEKKLCTYPRTDKMCIRDRCGTALPSTVPITSPPVTTSTRCTYF